jgi:DNA-binding transcriptional LysR family regulator
VEEARRAVTGDGEPRGTLRVDSLETTAALRPPPILAAFTAACPRVDVVLRTGTTGGLVADVLEYRLGGPGRRPPATPCPRPSWRPAGSAVK